MKNIIRQLLVFFVFVVSLNLAAQTLPVITGQVKCQGRGLCKLNCVMLYSHSISSVGERPAPRGGTTRPDECKITTI